MNSKKPCKKKVQYNLNNNYNTNDNEYILLELCSQFKGTLYYIKV